MLKRITTLDLCKTSETTQGKEQKQDQPWFIALRNN
jgi:hypothetical protein